MSALGSDRTESLGTHVAEDVLQTTAMTANAAELALSVERRTKSDGPLRVVATGSL
jgi:hypothetical protein